MVSGQLALRQRRLGYSVWLPLALLVLAVPITWLTVTAPQIVIGLLALPLALFLAADLPRAIIFIITFETLFPLFQNKSETAATLPIGIALLGLLFVSAAVSRFRSGTTTGRFTWTAIDYFVVAFVILCLLSAIVSSSLSVALGGVRDELKYFIIYLVIRWGKPTLTKQHAERITKAIIRLLFLIVAVGVVQYFVAYSFLADWANAGTTFAQQYEGLGLFSPDGGYTFAVQYRRVYSVLISPLYTGYAAMGGALFALVLYHFRIINRRAAAAWFAGSVVCLLLTYTRSAMLGLATGIIFYLGWLLTSRRLQFAVKARIISSLLVGLLLVTAAVYVVRPSLLQYPLTIFSSDNTVAHGHYKFLQSDITFLFAHPLGSGIGRSGITLLSSDPSQISAWTESWYFYIGTELGVPGLLIYLGICALVLRKLWQTAAGGNPGEPANWRAMGTALWFAAMLVAGIAGVPYFSWMLAAAMWTLVALTVNDSLALQHKPFPVRDRQRTVRR